MDFPGPEVLGRGVVVSPGGRSPLESAEQIVVDSRVIAGPEGLEEVVDRLHRHWVERRPVAVELGVEASELRQPVVERRAPWMLGPGYTPLLDRLHFLIWANNWDGRQGDPIWWWSMKAQRLGARIGGRADIILPGGKHAWVDGGPRSPLDLPVVHSQTVEQGRLRLQPPTVRTDADLADDQRAAVEHLSGPVRVIAPAGSGKTRTLNARFLHLVDKRGIEPGIITAVAYNNRAAREMRRRLQRDNLHIRTIHSLGWAILREASPGVTLLGERDVRRRLSGMIPKRPQPNTDTAGPYLEGLAEIRLALREPQQVEESRKDMEGLAAIFPRYRSLLYQRNEVDFDEQVYGAIEALLEDPELRQRWQRRCRHLLVDEFQDLTPAYLLLLRILASPELSVFGVGDDDQTIYGYAGADPKFLIEFDRYFPGAGAGALTVNYRCPSEVVCAASRLLSHNRIRVPKTIEAFAEPKRQELQIITPGPKEIALAPARIVEEWLRQGVSAGEVAILARVNSALLPMLAALENERIPFRSQLDTGLLNRTTMRATLAWIRLALDPESMKRTDLMEAVRRPARRINRLASELIPGRNLSLDRLARLGSGLDERKANTWRRFVNDIEQASQVARQGRSDVLLDYLAGEVGLGRVAQALDAHRSKADRSTHTDDLIALRRTATLYKDLPTFEERLRALLGKGRSTTEGVTATTIHRVKGLEWERVIVFGVDRGLAPHLLSDDLEEERRVLHVAITRGQQEVVVVAEKGRESPFLQELTREYRPPAVPTHALTPPVSTRAGDAQPTAGHRKGGHRKGGPAKTVPASPHDEQLFEKLRQWRLETAREKGVAAFIILYNRTLEEICRVMPRSKAELLQVPGIGDKKLANYGRDILEVVASHTGVDPEREHPVNSGQI
jgi:DNA helicase-2/ATP-dependent DNA helicase PcrA